MKLRLGEMEKLCEALPKREWRAGRPDMLSYDGDGYGPYKQVYMDNPRGRMHLGERLPDVVARGEGKNCVAIAEFIADAKSNYPAIIAWARRAIELLLIFQDQHTSKEHCGNRCDVCQLLEECGE